MSQSDVFQLPINLDVHHLLNPMSNHVDIQETQTDPLIAPVIEDSSLDEDFEQARSHINAVLETSETALDRLMDVVRDTDSPRAFEVAATLISTISSSAKDLLEIHEKRQRLKEKLHKPLQQLPQQQTNIQNNIAFRGTTKDLLELIKSTSV